MRRVVYGWLIASGLGLIGLGLMLTTDQGYAQDGDEAEYIGARDCGSCHRDIRQPHAQTPHARALQEVGDEREEILADFSSGDELRLVEFPGESEPRPFTADDIAFVVGSGRRVQRYLYEVEEDQYRVFPAEWNVETQTWQPYLLADSWDDPAYDFGANCAGCHTTGLNVERSRWEEEGVQCEACHGPGSLHVEAADDAGASPSDSELEELRSLIFVGSDPQMCGQCHSQGMASDEEHPFPVGYRPGANLLDQFTLAAADEPDYWWQSGHAKRTNMQFNEWLNSAHASALDTMRASPLAEDSCLRCHSSDYLRTERLIELTDSGDREGDPPDSLTLADAQFGVTCSTCHYPHYKEEQAVDPATLCADCHVNTPQGESGIHHPVKEMVEGASLVAAVPGVPATHLDIADGTPCTTCHMPPAPVTGSTHALRPIMPGEAEEGQPDSCSGCHTDLTRTDLQFLIDDTQASILNRLTFGRARLGSIPLPAEGDPARAQYDQVEAALTFVQNDGSLGMHNYAYADALLTFTERALSQLSVPGATLSPTEGPAPTAVSPIFLSHITRPAEAEREGVRPITVIVLSFSALVLLVAAGLLFRSVRRGSKQA